jgi:hypothetical protein
MSTQNDAHEKLVREIAETLASHHIECDLSTSKDDEKSFFIDLELPAARAMVENMAAVWMECWKLNNPYITDIEDGVHYAKQRGLFSADYDPEQQFNDNPSGPHAMGPGH